MEKQPEDVRAEIARGVFLVSPRPVVRHAAAQGAIAAWLKGAFGPTGSGGRAEWLFLVEPELRSEVAHSRLVPDLAAWRRSTGGWPGADEALIELPPDWVAQVLSPSTESVDRGVKREAYGLLGAAWLWLVDPLARSVEVFENVRGRMLERGAFQAGETLQAPPFEGASVKVEELFLPE